VTHTSRLDTIFVQIASYRDPELVSTIKDCIAKAKYPGNLTFSIAWQHSLDDKWDTLAEFKNDSRFKIVDIDYKDSQGTCWARSLAQSNYTGEKWYLQIDSHMRFTQDWDIRLIEYIQNLGNNAVLTTYPAQWYPDKPESTWPKTPHLIETYEIRNHRTKQRPFTKANLTEAVPARHVAAGFIFAPGRIVLDCPYDPNLYFEGEETNLAVRFFTHGYDLWHPHEHFIHHYYTRKGEKKHWNDYKDWTKLSKIANQRLNDLLINGKDLTPYGLGTHRSLLDWQKWSGIWYKDNKLHRDILNKKFPPMSDDLSKLDYRVLTYRKTLKWNSEKQLEWKHEGTLKFVAVIIDDKSSKGIFRVDISPDKLNVYELNSYTFDFKYTENCNVPYKLVLLPYYEHGWGSKIEHVLSTLT